MPTRLLAAIALAATTTAAAAADLPARSRIGAIFAEPPATVVTHAELPMELGWPLFVQNSPPVPGYYGRPGDFCYENYYGTSPFAIYGRLPYACHILGSCAGAPQ